MKICLLTHTMPRFVGDSAAPFIGELAEALVEEGHQVVVLAPFDKMFSENYRKYKLVLYKYAPLERLHNLGYSRTLKGDKRLRIGVYLNAPLFYLSALRALVRLIREEKVDVVSAHWILPNGFIAALAKKITGTPFTITIPGSDIYLAGKNSLFKSMVGLASREAGVVISDSKHYIKMLNNLGFFPKKVDIIRYGVDINKFKPSPKNQTLLKKFDLNEDNQVILAVGRLVSKKGFIYLINSFPAVLKEHPRAKLIIVGDGDQKRELQQRVVKLKLERSVVFVGTVNFDQLSSYYNLADVFIMPSIKDEEGNIDASPVSMMEAMACGIPVVATRYSGSVDIISNSVGFLVKEKNSQEIAFAITALLKRNSKKIRLDVRNIAIANFSTESTARRYLVNFKQLI